jgi:hypothetical protein
MAANDTIIEIPYEYTTKYVVGVPAGEHLYNVYRNEIHIGVVEFTRGGDYRCKPLTSEEFKDHRYGTLKAAVNGLTRAFQKDLENKPHVGRVDV